MVSSPKLLLPIATRSSRPRALLSRCWRSAPVLYCWFCVSGFLLPFYYAYLSAERWPAYSQPLQFYHLRGRIGVICGGQRARTKPPPRICAKNCNRGCSCRGNPRSFDAIARRAENDRYIPIRFITQFAKAHRADRAGRVWGWGRARVDRARAPRATNKQQTNRKQPNRPRGDEFVRSRCGGCKIMRASERDADRSLALTTTRRTRKGYGYID